MKMNVFVLVGVGDKKKEAGSRGKKSKQPLAHPSGPLLVPLAQRSHFPGSPEGEEIEL